MSLTASQTFAGGAQAVLYFIRPDIHWLIDRLAWIAEFVIVIFPQHGTMHG